MFTFSPFSLASICLVSMLVLTARNASTTNITLSLQDEGDFTAVDNYLKIEMKRLGVPGMSLGIVHGAEIVHLQGFGIADSTGRPVTPQTPIHIGSITKPFTALALMQLVEAGKIELDTPVQTYLPWFTLADKDASAQITIRHLLNQSSGISEKDGNRFWGSKADMEEAVRQMNTIQLTYPVGTKYQYCNMNFVILGLVIEKVSGESYDDYVNEHIFIPLHMNSSYTSHDAAATNGLADGHYYVLGHAYKREGVFPPAYLTTGLMASSAEDMAHYLIAQLNDGKYGDASILSPQGIAEMHTPAIQMMGQNYFAMGWAVGPLDGIRTIRFSGDIGVAHGVVMFQPESKWGVVLLANVSGFEQIMQDVEITKGVLSLLNERSSPKPVALPFQFRFLYWGILLTPILQMFGIGRELLHWQGGIASEPWQVILTVILNLAIALFFLLGIPRIVPFTISSLRAFYPELGYGLITSGILGFGWSLIYPILNWLLLKSK